MLEFALLGYCLRRSSFTMRVARRTLSPSYHSPNVVRVITFGRLRWAGHVARMEEGRRAFKILTGKPTGKRPLDPRMDLKETGINMKNYVNSAQDTNY